MSRWNFNEGKEVLAVFLHEFLGLYLFRAVLPVAYCDLAEPSDLNIVLPQDKARASAVVLFDAAGFGFGDGFKVEKLMIKKAVFLAFREFFVPLRVNHDFGVLHALHAVFEADNANDGKGRVSAAKDGMAGSGIVSFVAQERDNFL